MSVIRRIHAIMSSRGLMADEDDARAVLDVMREPTMEMCDAATAATAAFLDLSQHGIALRRAKHAIRWNAMIDAALKET